MTIGCPHCRVVGGPHDDGCLWHPSASAAREEAAEEIGDLRAEIDRLREALKKIAGGVSGIAAYDLALAALAEEEPG